eukprot:6384038-Alexandrium_andersonii.AAC.1
MSASLVGSEMCIRDRVRGAPHVIFNQGPEGGNSADHARGGLIASAQGTCLLYTSDAADDM